MAPVFGNGGRMLSEKSDYSVVFKKESVVGENQLVRCFFRLFLLVDWGNCCTFAVALFGNESEKAV